MTLEQKYKELCDTPSDIYMHLPKLREYASKCEHVTEMGFRTGVSTFALLAGAPKKLVSYDIDFCPEWENIYKYAEKEGAIFLFINASVLDVEIEQTDMLLIDTWHTGTQCAQELQLHAGKVNKYLVFHDVEVNWQVGEDGGQENGLKYAIEPFMASHKEWKEIYRTDINHGLLILERVC